MILKFELCTQNLLSTKFTTGFQCLFILYWRGKWQQTKCTSNAAACCSFSSWARKQYKSMKMVQLEPILIVNDLQIQDKRI